MKKLVLIILIASFGYSFAAPSVFVVDTSAHFQSFTGWGASQRNLSFSSEALNQASDAVYGSAGLGFNIYRAVIFPNWDYSAWTGETDKTQSEFLSILKNKGVNSFFAVSPTPPSSLKKNGKLTGDFDADPNNTIEPNNFDEYAKHIASFVQGYNENRGIDFDYVSIQNEPDVSSTDLSCLIGYEDYKNLFKIAGDEFAAQNLGVRLLAPETSGWNAGFSYLQRIFSNAEISKYLFGISLHSYKASQNREIIANFAGEKGIKEIWQTRWSDTLGSNSNPDDIQNAIKWAQTIMTDLNEGSATAWFAASLLGQRDSSLIVVEDNTQKLTKRYYSVAQFSRYIRPGYKRISAQSSSNKVYLTAWISSDGNTLSIVAVNPQSVSSDISIALPFSCASDFVARKTQTSAAENLAQKQDINAADGLLNDALESRSIVSYTINIGSIQPGPQVALTAPANGSTSQPLTLDFNWEIFPGADRYSFVLAKDAAFTDTVSEQAGNVPNVQVADLERSTTYYWRVKAFKQSMVIACSPVASFSTINNLPSKVTLAIPADGKEVSPDKVLFAWNQSTPAVDKYEIQLSLTSDFAQVEKNKTVTTTNTDFTALKEFTKYWWRVRAGNDGGWGEWSSTRSFTTTKSASIYESLPEDAVRLSPNPANDILRYELNFEPTAPTNITIYDANGTLMFELDNVNASGSFDLHYLNSGTYFLVVETAGSAAVKSFSIAR